MLKELTDWLFGLVKEILTALLDVLGDFLVAAIDAVLGAIVSLVALIPVPEFMSQGLQSLFSQLDGGVLYFVTALGLVQALAIIGTAYMFRLGRKVVTLFQW